MLESAEIEIIAQHQQGFILNSHCLSTIKMVYIFPTQFRISLRYQCQQWYVSYISLNDIPNMIKHNRTIQFQYKYFVKKADAEIFQKQKKQQLENELRLCAKQGGLLVPIDWLRLFISEDHLHKYIRMAKSLNCIEEHAFLQQNQPTLNAYFLGLWLGDGSSKSADITTMDLEIVAFLNEFATTFLGQWKWVAKADCGKAKMYRLCDTMFRQGKKGRTQSKFQKFREPFANFLTKYPGACMKEIQTFIPLCLATLRLWKRQFLSSSTSFRTLSFNPLLIMLHDLNLIQNKHIPEIYFSMSRSVRLQLLAGLLDTDGYLRACSYEITQKSVQLASDIERLANELGYFVYRRTKLATCTNGVTPESKTGIPVERLNISGLNLQDIPCLLPRKQFKKIEASHFLPHIVFSDRIVEKNRKRKKNIQWTKEQDDTLQKEIENGNRKWSAIRDGCNLFIGLSSENIRDRYNKLKKQKT